MNDIELKTNEQMALELAEKEYMSSSESTLIDILVYGRRGWIEADDLKEQYDYIMSNDIWLGDTVA